MPLTFLPGAKDSYSPGETSERLSSLGISEYFLMMCEKSLICISIGRDWTCKENQESNDCMSTDTEAANTVRHLQLHCPVATVSLQMAVHEALSPATATRPQEEEYQYDSNDSVLNLDEEYPGLAERVVQWRAARQGAACAPLWQPSDFGRPEQSHFNKLPNLRELLNQTEEAKACQRAPGQSVALTMLPFASVRDLDRQRQ